MHEDHRAGDQRHGAVQQPAGAPVRDVRAQQRQLPDRLHDRERERQQLLVQLKLRAALRARAGSPALGTLLITARPPLITAHFHTDKRRAQPGRAPRLGAWPETAATASCPQAGARRPTCVPSSRCIFFSDGNADDSSCSTMEALMYGTMPARGRARARPLRRTTRDGGRSSRPCHSLLTGGRGAPTRAAAPPALTAPARTQGALARARRQAKRPFDLGTGHQVMIQYSSFRPPVTPGARSGPGAPSENTPTREMDPPDSASM
jgi:hypothetical protein